MHYRVELWQRLEYVRESSNWSGREFARRAGLRTETHYSALYRRLQDGHPIEYPTLVALAKAAVGAGFSEAWVLSGTGDPRAVETPIAPSPVKRTFTPTPSPSSSLRRTNTRTALAVPPLPNRARAAELLVARGYDSTQIDEELALVAFDAQLAPCEDRPVSWWIDAIRERLREA